MVRKSAQERKEEIVQTALELMAEVGPDRVTTSMIAQHIGLTQPALFRHFSTKEDILLGVADWIGEHVLGTFWDGLTGNAEERLRGLIRNHLTLISRNPAIPALLFSREIMVNNAKVKNRLRSITTAYQERIHTLIREGQAEKSFRTDVDAEEVSFLILSFLPGLAVHWSLRNRSFDLVEKGLRLFDDLRPCLKVVPEGGNGT